MNTITYVVVLTLVVMVTIQSHIVYGQSYHFSNGWNPGKRSMPMQDSCHFRPEVQNLVFKLIEDEVYRLLTDSSCLGGVSALRNLLKKDLPYSVPITDRK